MAIKILSKYIIHQATIYRNVNYLKSTHADFPTDGILTSLSYFSWPNYLNRLQMIISKSGKIKGSDFYN